MNNSKMNAAWRSKRLKAQIMCALVLGVWSMAAVGTPVGAADEEVYNLGEVIVTNAQPPAPQSEAPAVGDATYAGGQVARSSTIGMLGKKDFLDVPFNITSITEETIQNQQATNIIDVTSNDPSVTDLTLSGASNAWSIRGFKTTQQDVQLNGIYGVAPRYYTGVEYLENVEILKGPSAMLSGMAPNDTVGGVINYVTKHAGSEDKNTVTLTYGEGHQFTQQLDMSRRFNDGKYGVRLNVLNRGAQEDAYEGESNSANTVALGLDAKGERWRSSLDLGYIYNDIEDPQYQVTMSQATANKLTSLPGVADDAKFGAPGTYRRLTEKYFLWKGEYDLDDTWSAWAAFGMRNTSQDSLSNRFLLNNVNGNAKVTYVHNRQINKAISSEIGVRGHVQTGSLDHEISVAASQVRYKVFEDKPKVSDTYVTSVYSPAWQNFTDGSFGPYLLRDNRVQQSVGISDIMTTADKKWNFIVGGRIQNVKDTSYTYNGTKVKSATTYDETAFTPTFGIVHKLNNRTSLYANYAQALSLGEIAPSGTENSGEVFAPYKTKQYEVGAKFDFGKLATTISAFTMDNPSFITTDANYYELAGKQRNRGIEVSVFGEPREGTRILGGITFMDAKYRTLASTYANYEGNQATGVPRWSAVVGVDQDIKSVEGLAVTTRLTYNGKAYVNMANTLSTSAWVRWDLGARYQFNWNQTPVTVRANVYNVLDTVKWRALQGSTTNAIYLGKGRTFTLSVSADF
ncbi:TonB-dependent siderophore receptor [uncultured Veillonella sp.]|uniref:TonB-dependent receptor n=1 Tax=uncultured Veillonella sp. TaxID=159268 RepID=UPI002604B412|nr:TonB-dependent receptor [uncultured Veillonella sp.]